jgi:hypothetical protein
MGQRFEFEVAYTPEDFRAYVQANGRANKPYMRISYLYLFGLLVIPTVAIAMLGEQDGIWFLNGFVALFFFSVLLQRWQMSYMQPHPDGMFLKLTRIVINDDHLSTSSEVDQSVIQWPVVLNCRREKKHLFVYLDRYHAIVIPRYCFADETQEDEFIGFVNSKIGSAPNRRQDQRVPEEDF